ncbi:DM13 domain-containing protein [Kibdelosporangium philippinense]|uniref:DM13 domain-containing protein n=1 Tax=Kibdelosporangium philippinense TaxID=211113 RepID=A0ABS8ZX16_9PSEU|nr:DM13 domain-containing protein [Kibdelosporangium philippinense]MCE7011863.1 DM13 domain-containing protein [Kibdelosporangium philippinense]
MRALFRRKVTWAVLAVLAVAGAFALWAFQPWKLFTSSTIDEALPVAETQAAPTATNATSATPAPPREPKELTSGTFVSQEHATSGQATVLELPDGQRVLRFTGLSSSDGPDLHVWLTDATAGGDWFKYDDGRAVKLGELKATHGNQNYVIPPGTSLDGLRSVVIWCDRFNVAFGSAPLQL